MYKIAIIGAGNIAKTMHIPTYLKHTECVLSAISDINQKLLVETAELFSIPQTYLDYHKMLNEIKPDIVSICTPNKYHAEQAIAALESGAHVVCEKPPALSVVELERMYESVKKNNKIIVFNFHHRYRDEVRLMKNWMDAQPANSFYFGEVLALRRKGVPGWGSFTNKELSGGGPLIDIGIHMLDIALYLLKNKKVKYVAATLSNLLGTESGIGDLGAWDGNKFSVEDSLFGQIVFDDGTSLQIKTAFIHHMQEKSIMNVKLHSKNESMELSPCRIIRFDEVIDIKYQEQIKYVKAIHDLIEKIEGIDVELIDINSVRLTQEVVDGLYKSASTGLPVFMHNARNSE